MIRFALAAKCGNFAARGFASAACPFDSPASIDANANEPNPTADRCSMARRDRAWRGKANSPGVKDISMVPKSSPTVTRTVDGSLKSDCRLADRGSVRALLPAALTDGRANSFDAISGPL